MSDAQQQAGGGGSVNVGPPSRESYAEAVADLGGGDAEIAPIIETVSKARGRWPVLHGAEDAVMAEEREVAATGIFHRGAAGTIDLVRKAPAKLAAAIEPLTAALRENLDAAERDAELSPQGRANRKAKLVAAHEEAVKKLIAEHSGRVEDLAGEYTDNLRRALGEQVRSAFSMTPEEGERRASFFLTAAAPLDHEGLVRAFLDHAHGTPWAEQALLGVAIRLAGDASGHHWSMLRAALRRANTARVTSLASGNDERSRSIRGKALRLAMINDALADFHHTAGILARDPSSADIIKANRQG